MTFDVLVTFNLDLNVLFLGFMLLLKKKFHLQIRLESSFLSKLRGTLSSSVRILNIALLFCHNKSKSTLWVHRYPFTTSTLMDKQVEEHKNKKGFEGKEMEKFTQIFYKITCTQSKFKEKSP